MKKPKSKPQPDLLPDSPAELSDHWGVSERTVKRLLVAGAPLRNEDAMQEWGKRAAKVPDAIRSRLRAKRAGSGEPEIIDPDWSEFIERAKSKAGDDPKAALSALTRARDFAAFKFEKASRSDSRDDMTFYSGLLSKFEGVVHDAQLRAKALGIDKGDLFPRAEAERIARVIVYWLMRSVDEIEAEICPKLAAASAGGPLHREDVRKIVESPMLEFRVLQPFARAAQVEAGTTLPAWFIDAMREAMRWTLKDGAASFDQIVAGQKAA